MDTRRTALWVIFSISLLMLWDHWQRYQGRPSLFAPSVATTPVAGAGSSATPSANGGAVPTANSAAVPATTPTAGDAAATTTPHETLVLANDVLKLNVSSLGGEITRAELLKQRETGSDAGNVVLLETTKDRYYTAQAGLTGAAGLPSHLTPFQVSQAAKTNADGSASMTLVAEGGGVRLSKTYTLAPGSYVVKVHHQVENLGAAALTPTVYTQLVRDGNKPKGESQFYSTFTGPAIYTQAKHFEKIDFADIEKGKASHATQASDGWAALVQHYFVSAWLPKAGSARDYFTNKMGNNLYAVGVMQSLGSVAPGAKVEHDTELLIGPQDQKLLASLAPDLEVVVDFGRLSMIAKPLNELLQFLHGYVGNWGWAIVLLTVIVKLVFFPLSAAGYKSMGRLKLVAPRMQQIKERYADDREAQQRAMMELYKTEKINPLGGCLPIVVQIPVFIALYWVLLASVEMRNAPWVLWIHDLAAPDPYYILPLIMAGSMLFQTWLNPPAADPVQQKVMWVMPLVFSFMFFFFPAGLVLYWVVNNLLSIAQQWQINRMMGQAKK